MRDFYTTGSRNFFFFLQLREADGESQEDRGVFCNITPDFLR